MLQIDREQKKCPDGYNLHLCLQRVSWHKHSTQVSSNCLVEEGERYTFVTFPFLYPVQHFIIMSEDNTVCIPETI